MNEEESKRCQVSTDRWSLWQIKQEAEALFSAKVRAPVLGGHAAVASLHTFPCSSHTCDMALSEQAKERQWLFFAPVPFAAFVHHCCMISEHRGPVLHAC